MNIYEVLVRDIGPEGEKRLRLYSVIGSVLIILCITAIILGLYRQGELDRKKWEIFATLAGWQFVGGGLVNTIKIALVDGAIALTVGMIVALGQVSRIHVIRWIAVSYAETFRALPTLFFVLFIYFGLSSIGFNISAFWALVFGSAIYNSAVLSNLFKAGILSIGRGQAEAAASIGLRYRQSMQYVIAPQALSRMLPSMVSQMVVLLKDSSLGFFIGYEELLRRSQLIGTYSNNFLQAYIVAGAVYIIVCYSLRRFATTISERASVEPRQSDLI